MRDALRFLVDHSLQFSPDQALKGPSAQAGNQEFRKGPGSHREAAWLVGCWVLGAVGREEHHSSLFISCQALISPSACKSNAPIINIGRSASPPMSSKAQFLERRGTGECDMFYREKMGGLRCVCTLGKTHRTAIAGGQCSAGWGAAGTQRAKWTLPHSPSPICMPSPAGQTSHPCQTHQ